MIHRFSEKILKFLIKSNVIENTDSDKEYYQDSVYHLPK